MGVLKLCSYNNDSAKGEEMRLQTTINSEECYEKLRKSILRELKQSDYIEIDLGSTDSLSPSFAYRVFGRLVDHCSELDKKIKFINDKRNLSKRVLDAIKRRRIIIDSESN